MSSRPIYSHQVITNGAMSGNVTSLVTIITQLSLIDYQLSWSGTSPVGTAKVQISNNYSLNADGTVENAGTWTDYSTIDSTATQAVSGNTGSLVFNLNGVAAYAVRIVYVRTSGTGTLQGFMNAKGSGVGLLSLNLLQGALTLVGGTGITITPSGTTITIDAAGGGSGANTALSNLASTAVNTSIFPDSNQNWDLGATGKLWGTVWCSALQADGTLGLSSGADISFNANGGTGNITLTGITTASGNVFLTANKKFGLNDASANFLEWDGAGFGQLRVSNPAGAHGDGTLELDARTLSIFGDGNGTATQLTLGDGDGTNNFVAIQAPTTIPANYTVIWPDTPGTAGQSLKIASVAGSVLTLHWA